jgi:exosome complex component RRP42
MIAKSYVESLATKGTRIDGRKFEEYRDISIEYGISSKSAEGSARVKIGDTEVVAGVKLDLGNPYSDRPDEGTIMVNVELIPMASPLFESGPPSINAIELSRVTDRGIRECGAIDFKKLCLRKGEKVWMVFIDIYAINADGNLFDACTLAAMAALRDARFPTVEEGDVIDYKKRTDTPLPISRLPLACTVWKLKDKFLVDPLVDEELASSARLSISFTEDDEVCSMQKGGDGTLTLEEIQTMVELAHTSTKNLRGNFK